MTTVRDIVRRFGTAADVARALGFVMDNERGPARVRHWIAVNRIPSHLFPRIVTAAAVAGIEVTYEELALACAVGAPEDRAA